MTSRRISAATFAAFSLFLLACPIALADGPPVPLCSHPVALIERVHDAAVPADHTQWSGDSHKIVWRVRTSITNYAPGTFNFMDAAWYLYNIGASWTASWINPDGSPGITSTSVANVIPYMKNKLYAAGVLDNAPLVEAEGVCYRSIVVMDATTNAPWANPVPISWVANWTINYRSVQKTSSQYNFFRHVEYKPTKQEIGVIPPNLAMLTPKAPLVRYAMSANRRVHGPHITVSFPMVPLRPVLLGTFKVGSDTYATYDETPTVSAAQIAADQDDMSWQASGGNMDSTTITADYTDSTR